jgi:proline utilization trans-activator
MDGEHVFSAAIVLIMVCISFPYDANHISAMDTALDLLQRMADRGNSHIGAKCAKLVHLRSMSPGLRAMGPSGLTPPGITQTNPSDEVNIMLPQDQSLLQVASFPQVRYDFPFLPLDMDHDDFLTWEEGYTNVDFNIDGNLDDYTNMAQMILE